MFSELKKSAEHLKPKSRKDPTTPYQDPDSVIFELHYKFTFAILVVFVILISSYSFIDSTGSAIQCYRDGYEYEYSSAGVRSNDKMTDVINRYCWISSTFTLPKHFDGTPGEDINYIGVGPYNAKDERIYHAYYQWVPLFLAFQAICFYFPHWLWKCLEKGDLKNIARSINNDEEQVEIVDSHEKISPMDSLKKTSPSQTQSSTETGKEENALLGKEDAKNLVKTCPRKKHRLAVFLAKRMSDMNSENARWSNKFNLCQALNLVNVVGQFFFTNRFLGGKFLTYGFEVIFYPLQAPESRVDALTIVFPKMTKCIFHAYGGSGTIQKFDALCVLGMNAINEKIFVFLWVWYLLLAAITLIGLVIGLGQYLIPSTRKRFLANTNIRHHQEKADLETMRSLRYGDWLFIHYLQKAVHESDFSDVAQMTCAIFKSQRIGIDEETMIYQPHGLPKNKAE